jgi:hypothetical protein
MSTTWFYKDTEYTSEDNVNQAVLDFKNRLDNNPTDWVVVRQLTGDAESGWVIPVEKLTDTEINNLDGAHYYSVSSVIGGGSEVGLTATEAAAKVAEYRSEFANNWRVNTITKVQGYSPSNADMSAY